MAGKSEPPGAGGGKGGSSGGAPTLAPPTVQPPQKKGQSERALFLSWIGKHPSMKTMATPIWQAAARFGGITALQVAAVIWAESKGNPTAANKSGAYGLGQILDNSASPANASGVPFFRSNHNISQRDKEDPTFVANYIAWRIGGYMAAHGVGVDDAWRQGYGGDQQGNYVSQYLPKGYVGIGGPSAVDTAGKSTDTNAVKLGMTDPYVTGVSSKGKLTVASDTGVAPKNVVMYDGTPMRVSDWQQLRRGLDQYFVSYTGGRPDNKTVLQYVNKGWSPYSLTVALAKGQSFWKSPIFKSQGPQYQDAAKDLLPQGKTADRTLVRSAILNNWTTGAFQAVLRAQPGYVQSNEFKGNTATLLNVHSSIYGVPDKGSLNTIKQAALAGWSPDQYASYLRSQPEYVQSPEYQTKTLNFLQQLGLITGQQAVLKKGDAIEKSPYPDMGNLPTDKRAPAGNLSKPEDTFATYG